MTLKPLHGRLAALCASVALAALCPLSPAHAEGWTKPPVRTAMDANGVDVMTGYFTLSMGDVGIGDLSHGRSYMQSLGWKDTSDTAISTSTIEGGSTTLYTVSFGGGSERFVSSGGGIVAYDGQRSFLAIVSSQYVYTAADGTVVTFTGDRISTITTPAGEKTTYTYKTDSSKTRLQSINSNRGFQLKYEYGSNTGSSGDWNTLSKVTAINNAVDYCDPTADSCSSLTITWPSATFASPSSGVETVTDSLGRATRLAYTSGRLTGIRSPAHSSDDVAISYYTGSGSGFGNHSGRVSSVVKGPLTWTYAYSEVTSESAPTQQVVTITGPGSVSRTITLKQASSGDWLVDHETNTDGTTSLTYDSAGRVLRVTEPLGNYSERSYDSLGNVTEKTATGGSLSTTLVEGDYASTCSNKVTCHKPTTVTGADGIATTYTYDSTHGGVLTATTGGVETRFGYTLQKAWFKTGTSTISEAATGIYLLTSTSVCATGNNSCADAARELKSTTSYGTGSSSVANNLLPVSTTTGAGDASLSATTTTAYDAFGRVSTVDGPLSGSNDLVKYRYDLAGQVIGVVGADPDGGGSLKHKATRTTYDDNGHVTKVESGKVSSQSDGDWSGFTVLDYSTTAYDAYGRPIQATAYSSADAILGVVQYSYDTRGRPECTAARMNPAIWATLPSSACTLGTEGSNGPDRISKTTYDGLNRVITQTAAYGTSLEQDSAAYTYTDNGQVETVTHVGVVTTYEYDDLGRPTKVRYPNPSDSGSSSSDYEQLTYDSHSRPSQIRLRDGKTVDYGYSSTNGWLNSNVLDAGGAAITYGYAYDNLGRQTTLTLGSQTLTMVYDALSRATSETGAIGAVAYEYDLAGRRTKLTYPDSFYVNYDWDLGGLTAIRENGATTGAGVLATYAYDDRGRRTGVTYGNGVTTAYSFDTASRLSSLTQDLASTGNDLTVSYTRNGVGQVLTRTLSNDIYEPTPAGTSTPAVSWSPNNLNQVTTVTGTTNFGGAVTYDARGNLTAETRLDGFSNPQTDKAYSYNLQNQLTGVDSATLEYDPAGRLSKVAAGSTTRFLYDAADMIAEYNSAGTTVQRRYVHGPGTDEPIVWYEGSGTSDRRWLVADHQGSIIAVTNGSGAAIATNSYDDYGKPGAANSGRFQYTGQMWLGEVGLYHYKARAYSPTLGRFLQADPIGYAGGSNMYAYVGGDPVNWRDSRDKEVRLWQSYGGLRPVGFGRCHFHSMLRMWTCHYGASRSGSCPYRASPSWWRHLPFDLHRSAASCLPA